MPTTTPRSPKTITPFNPWVLPLRQAPSSPRPNPSRSQSSPQRTQPLSNLLPQSQTRTVFVEVPVTVQRNHPSQPALAYQVIGSARSGTFRAKSPLPFQSVPTTRTGRLTKKLVETLGVMLLAVATLLGVGSMAAEPPVSPVPTAIAR